MTFYLFLRETWPHEEKINNFRKKGRPSRGILVYFYSESKKGVSVFDKSN